MGVQNPQTPLPGASAFKPKAPNAPPTLRTGDSPARQAIDSPWGKGGAPIRSPTGMDLTKPGTGEQGATYGANRLFGAGPTDDFLMNLMTEGKEDIGTGTNLAEESYYDFKGLGGPGLDRDAGLDPYYDRQRAEMQKAIDASFGARGMFGSSAATGTQADASMGLAAEQANREADWDIRRAGEERAWGMGQGTLGAAADASSRGNIGMDINKLMGLGNLGLGMGGMDISRITAGVNAGLGGQGAREGRLGDMFNRIFGVGSQQQNQALNQYNQMAGIDAALMGEQLGWGTGTAARGASAAAEQQKQATENVGQVMSLFSGGLSGFG